VALDEPMDETAATMLNGTARGLARTARSGEHDLPLLWPASHRPALRHQRT